MKKIISLLSILIIFQTIAKAQLTKLWDIRYGGSAIDEFHDILQTSDGGYLVTGYSESGISGDKSQASKGSGDFWVLKVDASGVKQWDKSYGGSSYDELFQAQQTSDGGYILGGWSNSGISGDKSQASQGAGDYWVVKTDANGNLQWNKTFGGSFEDYLQSIKQTNDGGYILAGRSNSGISGDKTQANRGIVGTGWDYWAVKIDATGTKVWDQTYGGADDDQLFSVQQTTDGGFIFGGFSASAIGGEKSQAAQGLNDYWIVKTDALGAKQWDKTFGGTNEDQLQAVIQTTDGGYLLGGGSLSGANGDKSQGSRGNFDYWIVKTNASGTKQWDKRFGGSSIDNLFRLIQTSDDGYLLAGASSSAAGGDKSQGNQGTVGSSYDYWLVKIDAAGTAQVDKRFGGSADDYAKSFIQTSDGSYVIGGWSTSGLTGDKSQASQGSIDYWITKISGSNSTTTAAVASPQCAGTTLNVNFTVTGTFAAGNTFTAELSDAFGDFSFPIAIGSANGTTSGTIAATLPSFSFSGFNYQIRVVSSNPLSQDIYPCAAFEIDAPTQYFLDFDNDTYGDPNVSSFSCTPLVGYVTLSGDCNDNDASVHSIPSGNDGVSALGLNCQGSSGNIFSCYPISEASSYQWILSSGLSSTFINNITPDTSISITVALGATYDSIGVAGLNNCGLSDTVYYIFNEALLPDAAGTITGDNAISSCTHQTGIQYSVPAIANATGYVWNLPASATIIGNADTNVIVVDYSAYGISGAVSVYGTNTCGAGPASNITITYSPIPTVEICFITVDSLTQKGLLWWEKPNAPQSDSLVIMRKNKTSGIFEKIATVKDTVPTSYLDLTSDPTTVEGETYQMAVKDTCGNIGSFSTAVTHKTIYLYGLLGWANVPKLYWYDYVGITDPARYYRVLKDTLGNGPFNVIVKDSVAWGSTYYATDYNGINCPTCRYVVELLYTSNCDTSARVMANKSSSRSNIANRIMMPPDPADVGVKELKESDADFSVYPVPAHGNLTLEFKEAAAKSEVQIVNVLGATVWKNEYVSIKIGNRQSIDVSAFPTGVYTVRLYNQNKISYRKISIN